MKNNLQKYLILIGILTFCIGSLALEKNNNTKPNIIYIYADDSGYGDVGCYGQELIQTPTIDRMAIQGMRFTQHYSGSPVCAPARCNLMTGKHNGHSYIRANERVEPHGQIPLEANSVMLSEKLKEAGYATACIGKWGLGIENTVGDPNKRGFDLFYGYYDQVLAHNHFPEYLHRNGKKLLLKNEAIWKDTTHWTKGWGSYSTRKEEWTQDLFLKEALGFIEQNAGKPFFLYLPVVIPHVNGEAPKGFKHEAPILEMYENKPWSREEKSYASGLTTLDSHINIILDKLKGLGLDKNTLVIFTSDNGKESQIFENNSKLKGGKRDLYEGGIRMPHVAYWPGTIKSGIVSNHLSAQYDFMATACEIAGTQCPLTDGISYLPTLTGKEQKEHDYLYFEYVTGSGQKALRMKKWKAVQLNIHENENSPIELYNMESDISETKDVAGENPDIIKMVKEIFNKEHIKSKNPKFQFEYEKKELQSKIQESSPTVSLLSSSLTGNPGDIITITIDEDYHGTPLDRRELTFDNKAVDWGSTYKWKATPGTHVLRLYSRWITEGVNAKGKPNKAMLQKILVLKISGWEKKVGFKHPGIYTSGDQLDIIKKNINGSLPHPMKNGLKSLKADLNYVPNPHEILDMENDAKKKDWDKDANAAWLLALQWAITGDERYGAKAVEIYNAWANTCKQIFQGNKSVYQFLHGTNHTGHWLDGADILSHYQGGFKGWEKSEVEKYNHNYVRKLLVPLALAWPGNIGSPYATQNQPLYVAEAQIALGIYLDDEALFNMGYDHFFEKRLYKNDDLGTKPHLAQEKGNDYKEIFGENPINLFELSVGRGGEYMERNRDEAHMNMCVTAIQKIAGILQHQGYDDVYTMRFLDEKIPRLLQGVEWLCKATFEGGAPTSKIGDVTFKSEKRLGNYEQVYDFYHYVLKDKYPLPKSFLDYVKKMRDEKAGGINVLLNADLHKK